MCELLDKNGELDENLMPLTKEEWSKKHLDYNPLFEEQIHKEEGFKHKIGSSKMKRAYEKKVNQVVFKLKLEN